jgi:hypothetical protein
VFRDLSRRGAARLARQAHNLEVTGSNPVAAIALKKPCAETTCVYPLTFGGVAVFLGFHGTIRETSRERMPDTRILCPSTVVTKPETNSSAPFVWRTTEPRTFTDSSRIPRASIPCGSHSKSSASASPPAMVPKGIFGHPIAAATQFPSVDADVPIVCSPNP